MKMHIFSKYKNFFGGRVSLKIHAEGFFTVVLYLFDIDIAHTNLLLLIELVNSCSQNDCNAIKGYLAFKRLY